MTGSEKGAVSTKSDKIPSRSWERIIESIGPYGLIGFCVAAIMTITTRPLDYSSWVSILILLPIIGICFLQDRFRVRMLTEIEKEKIRSSLELKKHKLWVEEQEPLLDSSSRIGAERSGMIKAFEIIIHMLNRELKQASENEKSYLEKIIQKIKEAREVVIFR